MRNVGQEVGGEFYWVAILLGESTK